MSPAIQPWWEGKHSRCPIQPFLVEGQHEVPNSLFDFFGSGFRGGHMASLSVSYQQFIGEVSVWHFVDSLTSPRAARLTPGEGAKLQAFRGTMSGNPGAPLTADFVAGAVHVPEPPGRYDATVEKARISG